MSRFIPEWPEWQEKPNPRTYATAHSCRQYETRYHSLRIQVTQIHWERQDHLAWYIDLFHTPGYHTSLASRWDADWDWVNEQLPTLLALEVL